MTTIAPQPQNLIDPARAPFAIWGVDAAQLHDMVWASCGVQVARAGDAAPVDAGGPALYLLLDKSTLVDFQLRPAVKVLHRRNPTAIRLRLCETEDEGYKESLLVGDDGAFQGFRRRYRPSAQRTARAWLTPDHRLAVRWQMAGSKRAAVDMMRGLQARGVDVAPLSVGATIAHPGAVSARRWLDAIMGKWRRAPMLFPGVYEQQKGVFAHETAEIPENVRFAGPVWIGAGARIEPGAMVIGPAVVGDQADAGETPVLDWDVLLSPHWNFLDTPRADHGAPCGKRLFDICFAAGAILVSAPLWPVLLLLIYIEDGRPFFFTHTRQTRGGADFPCYKFRTMCRDAERIKAELVARNGVDGPQFFMKNDPRVTRIGRFLRKSKLDELPQFWNVLVGHMSIVGPRPSPDKENQRCPAWREARLSVRPGITGLWQVRNTREPETDFQEWIQYDLQYVQHQSWRLDVSIIVQTIMRVLRG